MNLNNFRNPSCLQVRTDIRTNTAVGIGGYKSQGCNNSQRGKGNNSSNCYAKISDYYNGVGRYWKSENNRQSRYAKLGECDKSP